MGLFDFGLGLSVTREVGASLNREGRGEAARFVKAARNAYCLVGIAGAVLIAAVGLPLAGGLHLSAASRKTAPEVFVLAGMAFLAERLLTFTMAVLRGLRRFDTSNALAIILALWRASGIIVLIKFGTGLLAVMTWQVVATGAAAWAGQAAVGDLEAQFRFGLGRLDWNVVRPHLAFGLASQLTNVTEVVIWQLAPVVVGLILGSGWIAPFYVAQKFPLALAPIIWSTAEALFPAVSQHQGDAEITRTRGILEVGTRWTIVVALPLCLVLTALAPELLQAWVGEVRPGTILVLRLITAAVFMEGVAAASYQVLWGRGEVRTLLIVSACLAVGSLGLSLALLPRIGMAGAAWGLLLPMLLAAAAYLEIASRICEVRVSGLLKSVFDGLLLPALALLVLVIGIKSLFGTGWTGVAAASLGGGLVYLISFILSGAREEELMLVRKLIEVPPTIGHHAYRRLRHSLARVGFLRSGYYLLLAIREAMRDSPARGRIELDQGFERREDPWDYATVSYQRDRIRTEVEMLDAVRGPSRFAKVLEVGCAEGIFTEMLAPRCDSLLAVDISQVALARARQRLCAHEQVRFAELDLRVDPLPETYDLIVIIHALEYIRNPIYVRRARAKLVNALRPGGYLLVGAMKVTEIHENAWWGRYFLRSGKRINAFFAEHPALKVVRTAEFYLGNDYVSYDVLLRKRTTDHGQTAIRGVA
jgi:O-antigen/teichoic acid export membrane protein/SAM-dependent methyltransferase